MAMTQRCWAPDGKTVVEWASGLGHKVEFWTEERKAKLKATLRRKTIRRKPRRKTEPQR